MLAYAETVQRVSQQHRAIRIKKMAHTLSELQFKALFRAVANQRYNGDSWQCKIEDDVIEVSFDGYVHYSQTIGADGVQYYLPLVLYWFKNEIRYLNDMDSSVTRI